MLATVIVVLVVLAVIFVILAALGKVETWVSVALLVAIECIRLFGSRG